ncbi:cyclin-like protein [Dichotomocladium elegans]|nr:cyclin-like protein [Dichotomocladium elegans]
MTSNNQRAFVAGTTKMRRIDQLQQHVPGFTDENAPETSTIKRKGDATYDTLSQNKSAIALSTSTGLSNVTSGMPKGALVDRSNYLRQKMALAKLKASKQPAATEQTENQKQPSEDVKDFLEDNAKRSQSTASERKKISPVPVLPIQVPEHMKSKLAATQEKTSAIAALKPHDQKSQNATCSETDNGVAELSASTEPHSCKISQEDIDATLAYESEQEARARAIRTQDNMVVDWNDPLLVDEYEEEIFEYLRSVEHETMADPNYASNNQHEITWKLRAVLIDWIVEVHYLFQLLPETLYLAVNIVDRFLSKRPISINKLQLVGITSLFIATKFEEVSSPRVAEFVFMTDDALTEADLIRAERFILQTINFNICYANPLNFFRRIAKVEYHDVRSRTIAKYFMEISCLDHRFIGIPPSKIAAAAMWLTQRVLDKGSWTDKMVELSGYTWPELKPVVRTMLSFLSQPITNDAFYRKWAGKRMIKASVYVKAWVERHYKCK